VEEAGQPHVSNADYLIDVGPEGRDAGGEIFATGKP
jgi:excinuclease UvrABC ATPase subunit